MIDKTRFKKMFGKILSDAGFDRKGQTWYLTGSEVVIVVNLQKSDYAEKFYVNIGIALKAMVPDGFPKENHCQIQVRLGSLFSDYVSLVDKACSLEFAQEADLEALMDLLKNQLVPFCMSSLSLDGLRKSYAAQLFSNALIFKEARQMLES